MKRLFQLSKRNLIYVLIIMLTITLTLLLLIKEETELIIISREYPFSIYHSDNYETIDIELLTNYPNSYHFDSEFIASTKATNTEEELSLSLKDVRKSSHSIYYQDMEFYLVTFSLTVPFTSNDLEIEMENVTLEILYDNNETIEFKIGELNYLFNDSNNSSMTLSNLSATHEDVNGYNTIGGVNIELSNTSMSNIVIKDIKLLSNSVHLNKSAMITGKTCDYISSVRDCLGVDNYDFNQEYNDEILNTLLGKNNSVELYIPLIYENKTDFIYEFAIVIEFQINSEIETLIIDNFPYMKTSVFTTFDEDEFNVYTFTNSN